jgi:hypothetical protein
VLADLQLIRPLSDSELKRFGREESRGSVGDLKAIEDRHSRTVAAAEKSRIAWQSWLPATLTELNDRDRPRRHGLLSKAQRTQDIAGWSAAAQSDVEISGLSIVMVLPRYLHSSMKRRWSKARKPLRRCDASRSFSSIPMKFAAMNPYSREIFCEAEGVDRPPPYKDFARALHLVPDQGGRPKVWLSGSGSASSRIPHASAWAFVGASGVCGCWPLALDAAPTTESPRR